MLSENDQDQRKKAIKVLKDLIRIRTHQPEGNERDLIEYILEQLPKEHFEIKLIDHGANRASLIAILPGRDRSRALAYVGHTDTVSIGSSRTWTHPPFAAKYENGRIYGRGAANMKGGLTAMIMAAFSLASGKEPLPRDVYFCFTADGDMNGMGADCLARGGYLENVEELILLDPTDCRIGIKQKGAIWLDIYVKGRFSYSCIPEHGLNAIDYLILFKQKIDFFLEKYMEAYSTDDWKSTCVLTKITSSCQEQLNYTVPDTAEGLLDIRTLPGSDNEHVLSEIHNIAKSLMKENRTLQITVGTVNNRLPIAMDERAPLIQTFQNIYKDLGTRPEIKGLNFFSDTSRLIPVLGVPFITLGPGKDIFCTLSEENVTLDSVLFISKVITRYACLNS